MKSLQDSIQYSKGVGPKRLELLKRLGIQTLRDLLYFVPRGYEDGSLITPINRLRVGERATIKVRVVAAEKFRGGRGRAMAQAEVEDDSGRLTCPGSTRGSSARRISRSAARYFSPARRTSTAAYRWSRRSTDSPTKVK